MKKAIRTLSIWSLILFVLGFACYFLLPLLPRWMGETAAREFYGNLRTYFLLPLDVIKGWFNFSAVTTMQIIGLVVLGVAALVVLIWLILIIVKKRGLQIFPWLIAILCVGGAGYVGVHLLFCSMGGTQSLFSELMSYVGTLSTTGGPYSIIHTVMFWAAIGLMGIAAILAIILIIVDWVYLLSGAPAGKRRVYASADDDHLTLVRDEPAPAGPSSQEIRELLHEELSSLDNGSAAPAPAPAPAPVYYQAAPAPAAAPAAPTPVYQAAPQNSGISGPLLVQYINTYGPQQQRPAPQPYPAYPYPPYPYPPYHGPRPQGEPCCKQEEPKKEEAPAPAPVEEKKEESPNIAAIRAAMNENLTGAPKDAAQVAPAAAPSVISVGPSLEEIRAIVKESIEESTPADDDVRRIVADELQRSVIVEVDDEPDGPAALSAEDIRRIIADEISKSQPEPEPEPAPEPAREESVISLEDLRKLIAEELDKRNIYHIVEEVHEVPAPQPEPEPEPAPAPEPEPAPAPEPEPVPEPVVVEPAPEPAKIVRVSFDDRMKEADRDVKNRYNELKSELMSYGLNSRVSNSGDTFRLHRKTYCKITIAGKNLKLYMALDPNDYANTTLPISDAGHKGAYADIPLVFKVKSDLSMRRAKQLIADCLAKDGIPQGKVEERNWANELVSEGDDGDADEE